MCGIAGIFAFNTKGCSFLEKISTATLNLQKRGPDAQGIFKNEKVALGHRRLSIIDITDAGSQPMTDASGNFTIIFNGEFFNYLEHKTELIKNGVQFKSESDTEVLLYLYIKEGYACLNKVNGFFSLAIYNHKEETIFVARDRFGVKPLYYYADDDKFIFASEMKAIYAFEVPMEIDTTSLFTYLQLNYIPAPLTILKVVKKLEAANWMLITANGKFDIKTVCYYKINAANRKITNYDEAKKVLYKTLDESVQRRLVADVPLGSFLSGGIDSSVIAGLAAKQVSKLNTFSIGFKNEPLFDETYFAELVAKKFKTEHTVFSLTNEDLFNHLFEILDYTDEPFADSSAIAVYILSQETRKHVTVALSGDGADEIFGGYNKHRAEWILRNNVFFTNVVKLISPLTSNLKGSRNSKIGNKIRQVNRFAEGSKMNAGNRYWRWCAFADESEVEKLLIDNNILGYDVLKQSKTSLIISSTDLNDILISDTLMVLPDDMLTKVDRMSMANSLEVRTPFLDYEVVDFAFSVPSNFKIDQTVQKKLLKDTFKDLLPPELQTRSKQGFEVPLIKWFKTGLKSMITDDLLNDTFILEQKIFNPEEIKNLKKQLFSDNPGEIHARIWGLIVFQYWYKKYFLPLSKIA